MTDPGKPNTELVDLVADRIKRTFSGSKGDHRERLEKEVIRRASDSLETSPSDLDRIVELTGLVAANAEGSFFTEMRRLRREVGWCSEAHQLFGLFWSRAYETFSPQERERNLNQFVEAENLEFFTALDSFPEVIIRCDVPAKHLESVLRRAEKRVQGDLGNGRFWRSVEALAIHRKKTANEVLRIWIDENLDDDLVSMAALILGVFRNDRYRESRKLDELLEVSESPDHRRIFIRSWITVDRLAVLSDADYALVIDQANRSPDDRKEVFNFLRRTLPSERRSPNSFATGIDWIHENFPVGSEDYYSTQIIELATQCDARCEKEGCKPLRPIIPKVFSIPEENKGVWRLVDELLANLFARDEEGAVDFLLQILDADPNGVLGAIDDEEYFCELSSLLRQRFGSVLVSRLLDEVDFTHRKLGYLMFDRLQIRSLDASILRKWSDRWVALLLFQIRLEFLQADPIVRFLLAMRRRVERGEEPLKEHFRTIALFHMKDLPGGVLEPIKRAKKRWKPSAIDQAVERAEAYFSALKTCHNSEINSMEVPGFQRSYRLLQGRRSREFAEGMESASVLFGMIPKSYLLYGGRRWRTYANGSLSSSSDMSKHSTSMEMNRTYSMHSDEMSLQRRRIRIEVIKLQEIERMYREKIEKNDA